MPVSYRRLVAAGVATLSLVAIGQASPAEAAGHTMKVCLRNQTAVEGTTYLAYPQGRMPRSIPAQSSVCASVPLRDSDHVSADVRVDFNTPELKAGWRFEIPGSRNNNSYLVEFGDGDGCLAFDELVRVHDHLELTCDQLHGTMQWQSNDNGNPVFTLSLRKA